MTRESLKEYYMQIADAPSPSNRWLPEIVCEQVDLIFDDFQSRTCENCKHYITEYTTRDNHCGYDGMFEIAEMLRCTKDFGCLKFERKDK